MRPWIWVTLAFGCNAAVPAEPLEGTSTTGPDTPPIASTGGADESTTGPQPTTATTSGASTSGYSWETEGADEGYATTGGCGFTCPSPPGNGGGFPGECNLTAQNCPRGERCSPWANDGGPVWNAARCVPVSQDPGEVGDACTFEGSSVSGIDTCDIGLWCGPDLAPDAAKNSGTCMALCSGAICPENTLCVSPGPINEGVCSSLCDPLAPDSCAPGWGCLPAGFGFACHPTVDEPLGTPCDANMQCGPGSVCTEASQCDDEFAERCCVAVCDRSAPSCADGQTCEDWGSPLSAYADVGYCDG
mgnify:CR=1 FL=1